MKKYIVFVCILFATAAYASGGRPKQIHTFGSDDHQRNHVVTTAPSPPSPVPEPATLMLLGVGLVGLAAWARKR